jgi:glycosyltransferase involved in cell wall biosynthesis
MAAFRFLKRLVPPKWKGRLHERIVSLSVRHHYGPKAVRLSRNEAAVTCVLKNGEFYIQQFIEHYLRMGFRHIFFLDNGSSDKTVEIAKTYENVTVYRCKLPIETYQASLKRHLAESAIVGGWCLDVDIDEFFDYPFSDRIGLQKFLDYLNGKHYTAVITQMLDMFSDRPLSYLAQRRQEDLKQIYHYYDLSQVRKTNYRESELALAYARENELPGGGTALCFGGIRKTLYGIDPLLTKHSLFRLGDGMELFPHIHFVNKARLADVSCLLLHYKLASNACETTRQNRDAFFGISKGYSDLLDLVTKRPDYRIKGETAMEFRRVDDLLETGFLFVSDDYRTFAGRCGLANTPQSKAFQPDLPRLHNS